ncbi:MAG TPA: cache domain-containing protein [Nitrososphaeraceae archaeon]|nr:cache domain-containing protein [Nitrososphaeraceae archaeon]
MRKMITVILLASITIPIVSVIHTISPQAPSAVYAQGINKNINSSIYDLASNGTLANILSKNLVNYLNESASIIKLTSVIPDVSNAEFANKINSSLHGIADSDDVKKRQIADNILQHSDNLEAITFLMPNGDMYMQEPYSRQLDLSRNNFAFRDYYQGAIETKQAFLGDAIVSSSTGETVALISVPIYSQKNQSLLGIWSGVLNLSKFYDKLQSLSLPDDIRVIYTDGNGQKIGDSNSLLSNKSESFAEFNSFKNGKFGKAGNGSETINGTRFLVSYAPISILSKTWVVMVMTNLG